MPVHTRNGNRKPTDDEQSEAADDWLTLLPASQDVLSLYCNMQVEVQRLKKGYLQDESGVGSDAVMVGLGRIGRDGQICNAVKRRVTTR